MSFALQVGAALLGNYEQEIAAGRRRVEQGLQAAMEEVAEALQEAWRNDVEGSGLAKAGILSRTIRQRVYRNGGLDPAAVVYSKFPVIQRAFERAETIRARNGRFLLVPNPAVWPGGRVRRARSSAGSGQGGDTIQAARARFGELTFVPPRAGRAGLVLAKAKYSEKTGRFRQAKANKSGAYTGAVATIVVFFVVRQARQPKMLRGAAIRRRAEARFPQDLQRAFDRNLSRIERGTLTLPPARTQTGG